MNATVEIHHPVLVETPPAQQGEADGLLAVIARAASDPRVDVDKFERLLEMKEKMQQSTERREFNAAIASAKSEIGPIFKAQEVDFVSKRTGGRTRYRYEDFAAVARAISAPLAAHGLSYRFRSEQKGDILRVTCIVSRGGYSEETSLQSPADMSDGKNSLQAIGSAVTYLQRYTLKLALGLAASADDDGRAAGSIDDGDLVGELRSLIVEANDDPAEIGAYTQKVVDWLGAPSVEQMTPDQLRRAIAAVKVSISRKGKAA